MGRNFEATRQFAEFGLADRSAVGRESASGPDSSEKAARKALQLVRRTIRVGGVRSVVDPGCGDWHWLGQSFVEPQRPAVCLDRADGRGTAKLLIARKRHQRFVILDNMR